MPTLWPASLCGPQIRVHITTYALPPLTPFLTRVYKVKYGKCLDLIFKHWKVEKLDQYAQWAGGAGTRSNRCWRVTSKSSTLDSLFFFYHHNMSPFELWYPSRYACWVVYPIKSPGRTNTLGSMNFFLQRLNMSMHACIYPSSLNILARNLVAYIRVGVQVQHVSLYLQVVTLNGRALQHYRGGWEYNNFYIWWWLYR